MPSGRARQEWANRVRAEYGSAAITARVLHLSIAAGLPRSVLDLARRVVGDELDHAELSHDTLTAIGGTDHPIAVDFEQLTVARHAASPLAELVEHVVHSFCFGETLAVPLFRAMRAGTTHPVARTALDRILSDEAVHRAFGWKTLDALLEVDGSGVRAFAASILPQTVDHFFHAYGAVPDAPRLTEAERAVGLLPPIDYRSLFARTWARDIQPRFQRREVATPAEHW